MSRMNDPMQGTTPSEQQSGPSTTQSLRDQAGHASEAARQQYEQLRQQASEYYDQGRAKAEEWQQNLEQYIHDQPMKSLLMAAGVGFLLGAIWKRS